MKVYDEEPDEESTDIDDLDLPNKILIGNRKNRRRHGVRSSYKNKLQELQKEKDRGDRT